MLDTKNIQKWPLTDASNRCSGQGSFLFCRFPAVSLRPPRKAACSWQARKKSRSQNRLSAALNIFILSNHPLLVNANCPPSVEICILHIFLSCYLYIFTPCNRLPIVLYYNQKGWYQCTGKPKDRLKTDRSVGSSFLKQISSPTSNQLISEHILNECVFRMEWSEQKEKLSNL